jgi:hypothetical protein
MMKASVVAIALAIPVAGMAAPNPAARDDKRALPARPVTFDGGNCTAKFVRSASGIVNETNRECTGDQNPWVDADVRIQFRPLNGTPNPTCDPEGLVTTFVYTNTDPALAQYFPAGTQYNACVYLEDSTVVEGTLDSASATGATTDAVPLAGQYEVCVRGTWMNRGTDLVDAEYVSQDNWTTFSDGLPASDPLSATLGPNWGDVRVNGQFVNWGAYSTTHKYCTVVTLAQGDTLNLAVFDGSGTTVDAAAYTDNVGTLEYTITYLGM